MLKEKWWKQKKGGGKCKVEKDNAANELNLTNVGGVFLVLVAGLCIACCMVCLERCFSRKAPSSVQRMTHNPTSNLTAETSTAVVAEPCQDTGALMANSDFGHSHRMHRHHHGFENGHVVMDSSAMQSPPMANCNPGGSIVGFNMHNRSGSTGHIPHDPRHHTSGYLSTSLSTAALNQTSCAVPMHQQGHVIPGSINTTPMPPPSCPWVGGTLPSRNNSSNGRYMQQQQQQHQQQCPHYHHHQQQQQQQQQQQLCNDDVDTPS